MTISLSAKKLILASEMKDIYNCFKPISIRDKTSFVLLLILLLIASSCTNQKKGLQLENADVQRVLERAMDVAGGMQVYEDIDSIIYQKKSILYLEDGTVESSVEQVHKYKLLPSITGEITWNDSIGNHSIVYTDQSQYITLNQNRVQGSEQRAKSSFLSSYFVLLMPFKILDPGATLTYEGQRTLDSGVKVDVIKSTYDTEEYDNHSTNDEWYFYFAVDSGKFVANAVYHEPTYAYIENNETSSDHPIVVNLYRKSWRVDENLNKEYLRGEFWYDQFRFTSKN